jgi:hypothetical protein
VAVINGFVYEPIIKCLPGLRKSEQYLQ